LIKEVTERIAKSLIVPTTAKTKGIFIATIIIRKAL